MSRRYSYDVAVRELGDGTSVLDVLPRVAEWMPPEMQDGVLRLRMMLQNGVCPCGAVATVTEAAVVTDHTADCTVPNEQVQRLVAALVARAYEELPGVIR